MADIQDLRNNIDVIDKEITSLFLERMKLCRAVGEYKAENGLAILDTKREKELLQDKLTGVDEPSKEGLQRLFQCIMDISKDEQKKVCTKAKEVIGFCGIEGAYGYFAAKSIGERVCAYSSFKAVADAVEGGEISKGILPIENTTSGSVLEVYDILGESSLYIIGEIIMPISHSLLGLGSLEDVKSVCSHHQALTQCNGYIETMGFKRIQSVNTAVAAKECKEKGDVSLGVIASEKCGELYGLNVLRDNIEDRRGNKTRFVVVSQSREGASDVDKASVTFTLPHRQGALCEVLSYFNDVNLTKIESRPVGDFEYRFYLDFIDRHPTNVLNKIMEIYNTVKVLGVYKSCNPVEKKECY